MTRKIFGVRTWFLILSLLTSVPLAAFAGYTTYRLAGAEQNAILTNLIQRNDAAASAVQQHIQNWSALLMALTQSDAALKGNFHELHGHAIRVTELYPEIAAISLVDSNGDQLFNTLRPFGTALPRITQPEVARRVIETGQPQLSDVFTGAIIRSLNMAIGAPLTQQGQITYSLHLIIPIRVLNEILDSQNLPEGWYAAIVNHEGTVLARNRAPEDVVGRKATPAFLDVLARSRRGVLDLPSADGTALKRAFVKMPPWDVTVMVGVPENVYWAPFRHSMLLVGLGGLALITMGLILASWFSARLALAVADISLAASTLGRGEAPSPKPTRVREINALGQALLDVHDLLRRHDAAREAERHAATKARLEAEQANLSKSKFIASASHDLRQPLQSLMLFTNLLHAHVEAPPARHALANLERGLDALKDLLDSLLDVSRLDAGAINPLVEDFEVTTLLDPLFIAYKGVAESKGLMLETSACGATVRSDRTLLGRMVRNLLENAVRYTNAGTIRMDCHVEDHHLRIAVSDTGIGIPAEHLARIWEEFHQVANPERSPNQGLGLGLAIVRRLSQLLDHPVEVRSTPGQGSVFTITVPLGASATEQAPATEPLMQPAKVHDRFAVVVDDDGMVLLGLTALLEEWGYRVLTAASADQALACLDGSGEHPDIILSDYRLPQGTGTETILKIRAHCAAKIPGILLTGETGADAAREAAVHGLHLIHKPVTPRQLAAALRDQTKPE